MSEKPSEEVSEVIRSGFGKIELVPEVLLDIARRATLRTEGVAHFAEAPATESKKYGRRMRQDGILLALENSIATFDLYLIMAGETNIMQTAKNVQSSVIEAIDQMLGLTVQNVNVHIEDVAFEQGA